jgi:signal transduction histidine kinase
MDLTRNNDLDHMTILVVDDEKIVRNLIRHILEREGYPCFGVDCAEDAIKLIKKTHMDVIIADIELGGMSGIDLLKIIKKDYDSDVIVITGYREDYSYESIIEIGASDFMIKPFSSKELLIRLRKVLKARKLHLERNQAYNALRSASRKLITAQELERRRIARDLHDKVAQDITAAKIAVDTLFDGQKDIPEDLHSRITELSTALATSIQNLRTIAYDLRPPMVDQLGLTNAIYQFSHEFSERCQLNLDFNAAGMEDITFSSDIEINLFRIVQEALANIEKHAHATDITLRLIASHPNVMLRIEDNGNGFNVQDRLLKAVKEKRMGLNNMEERVHLIGGTIGIKSNQGQGTSIVVRFPIQTKSEDQAEPVYLPNQGNDDNFPPNHPN